MVEQAFIAFTKRILDPAVAVLLLPAWAGLYGVGFSGYYLALAAVTFPLASLVFHEVGVFRSWKVAGERLYGREVLIGWLMVVGLLLLIGFASKQTEAYSRLVLFSWILSVPPALVFSNFLFAHGLARFRAGRGREATVIVGATELGVQLARKLREDGGLFSPFLGFYEDRGSERLPAGLDAPVLGPIASISASLRKRGALTVFIALPLSAQPRVVELVDALRGTAASVYFIPDIPLFNLMQARFHVVRGVPVVAVCESPLLGSAAVSKRLFDLTFALAALVLLSPLMALIAAGVKLSSPGPVLFRQRRYGLGGDEIVVYKFRTMRTCEDGGCVTQASRGDGRVTPLGGFLRKTSLDELPQLFNVLRGNMSVVGPRPHAVAHNEFYRELIHGYMLRSKVRPGITGWAQVNGLRGETRTVERMKARVDYDLEYIRNWSLALDVWIIAKTASLVFKDDNAY